MNLTVKPLKQKDAGRRLAAIDRMAAEKADLSGGDFIKISADNGTAIARVWPGYPEDDDRGVVRIDGNLRQEADVGIDDSVTIEKADVEPASRVTVALPQQIGIRGMSVGICRTNCLGSRSRPVRRSGSRSDSGSWAETGKVRHCRSGSSRRIRRGQ
jgi:Cell division protein 48 (CDC48), N-terminal domain.